MKKSAYTPYMCNQILETVALVETKCISRSERLILALPDDKPCYYRRLRNFRELMGYSLAEYCARRRATENLRSLSPNDFAAMPKTMTYCGIHRFKQFVVKHLGTPLVLQEPITAEDIVYQYLLFDNASPSVETIEDAFKKLKLDYTSDSAERVFRRFQKGG